LHRASKAYPHRARAGSEQNALPVRNPRHRLGAPAVHRILEVASHREARCGEPGRHPVECGEGCTREFAEAAEFIVAASTPVAVQLGSEAIEQRAARARQHKKPRHDREAVAMGIEQPMLNCELRHLRRGQRVGRAAGPLLERGFRGGKISVAQGIADHTIRLAHLPQAHGVVKHARIQHPRQKRRDAMQQVINEERCESRYTHRQQPSHDAMPMLAGVEVALDGLRVAAE